VRAAYTDITTRIVEAPKWWDENGVPRYSVFSPDDTPNIYAREAVLYEIECQECGQTFEVAEDWSWWPGREIPLSEFVKKRLLHYGDPPRHGGRKGCRAGDTMNSIPRRVLQFWSLAGSGGEWIRVGELEGVRLDGDEPEDGKPKLDEPKALPGGTMRSLGVKE
jgi:hypothetical protein